MPVSDGMLYAPGYRRARFSWKAFTQLPITGVMATFSPTILLRCSKLHGFIDLSMLPP